MLNISVNSIGVGLSALSSVVIVIIVVVLVIFVLVLLSLNKLLADIVPGPDPDQWMRVRKESGETLNSWGENVTLFRVGYRDGTLLVVYISYNRLIARTSSPAHS